MIKEDYLLRQLEQAWEALLRAAVATKELEVEQAEQALGQVYKALLKVPRTLFVSLTAASLVPMLGSPEIVRSLARASFLEGEIAAQRGKKRHALSCYQRALELFDAVGDGDVAEDIEAAAAVRTKFAKR